MRLHCCILSHEKISIVPLWGLTQYRTSSSRGTNSKRPTALRTSLIGSSKFQFGRHKWYWTISAFLFIQRKEFKEKNSIKNLQLKSEGSHPHLNLADINPGLFQCSTTSFTVHRCIVTPTGIPSLYRMCSVHAPACQFIDEQIARPQMAQDLAKITLCRTLRTGAHQYIIDWSKLGIPSLSIQCSTTSFTVHRCIAIPTTSFTVHRCMVIPTDFYLDNIRTYSLI
jgi:hypothetical protein